VVDEEVRNIDLFPTVLDYLNRQISETAEGKSLLNLLNGK
jgi:arylsulfatase A-like enzyme